MSDPAELSRLRWRCRRGMRELDQLLVRYLDQRWPDAPEHERDAFRQLLAVEDDRLWRWVMGRETVDDGALRGLVERILALPH